MLPRSNKRSRAHAVVPHLTVLVRRAISQVYSVMSLRPWCRYAGDQHSPNMPLAVKKTFFCLCGQPPQITMCNTGESRILSQCRLTRLESRGRRVRLAHQAPLSVSVHTNCTASCVAHRVVSMQLDLTGGRYTDFQNYDLRSVAGPQGRQFVYCLGQR